jgi:rhamnogalacturonan endolyase
VNIAPYPKEISRMTTGVFANQLTGKYSYNVDYYKLGAWGRASEQHRVGQWVVTGSREYVSNGPSVRDYVNGWGLLYFMPIGGHYNDSGITINSNANWAKIFGPWALYFNTGESAEACWQDAKNQALAEARAWPYSWLTAPGIYQPRSQRASITGKLIIHDKLRPGASADGAWVGLAAPDSGNDNAKDNWQFQSDGYQYWVQAEPDGTFNIPEVQTVSPFGGEATYQLYAYSAGTNRATGCVGEFSTGPFTFGAGTTNLGTLTWNVPHQGASLAWEIGYPNRTADKFRHGDDYARPDLWNNLASEFSDPLEYTVGVSDWSHDWNYAQFGYQKTGKWVEWPWRIHFTLTNAPVAGNATLVLACASVNDNVSIRIQVNDEDRAFTIIHPAIQGGNAVMRQGIRAKYDVERVSIPASLLKNAANTITLVTDRPGSFAHVMYDYLSLELPAVPEVR